MSVGNRCRECAASRRSIDRSHEKEIPPPPIDGEEERDGGRFGLNEPNGVPTGSSAHGPETAWSVRPPGPVTGLAPQVNVEVRLHIASARSHAEGK